MDPRNKQIWVALLISDKVNFKLKSVRRYNEGHFILMKVTIHQEEILYTTNTGAPIYIKKLQRPSEHRQTLTQW
jgi:hypothetical protein